MFLKVVAEALNGHSVQYALAGGYAVSFHGAVRTTFDIDLVVEWSLGNLEKAERAFQKLKLQSRLPVVARDVFFFRDEYISKRNLVAWSFVNPTDPTQLIDVIITNDLSEMTTTSVSVLGTRIPILSIESLIEMKKQSGRPQDLEDIRALERLK